MARVLLYQAMLNAKFVKSSSARLNGSAGSPSRGEKPHGWGPWVARLGKWSWPQPAGRCRVRAERVDAMPFAVDRHARPCIEELTGDTETDIGAWWRPKGSTQRMGARQAIQLG